MAENDKNKMTVEKIDGEMILLRKEFSGLRATNVEQTEVLFEFNAALYRLERKFSNVKKLFFGEGR